MRMIVGLAGKAGAGKDVIADYLVREHGFIKVAWAAPLKAGLAAMGLAEPANRDDKERPVDGFPFTWREAAQTLGTEWGRSLDPDIWVKMAEKRVAESDRRSRFVFSDCRFDNETAMVRSLGGHMLFVTGREAYLGPDAGHSSEAGPLFYPNIDEFVYNDGSLSQTYDQVTDLLELPR